ncbi:hypothetical protein MKZ38_009087 [Zalerion maritima]|uniref:Uncharacterized protein n=1 Tax=Zalerion maritima TaxID=339359 RepID=A0AAD5RVB8_9PEZI|nr:hypothetical protein MKZ38_009087 [Zalerion maritima]
MDAQNAIESTTTRPPVPDRRPLDIKKTTLDLPSSPPIKLPTASSQTHEDEGNSDAETEILPGKDGFSPSKTRKVVNKDDRKHADSPTPNDNNGSNGDYRPHQRDRDRERDRDRVRDVDKIPRSRPGKGAVTAETASSLVARRKKSLHDRNGASLKDGSSGLSSAPASPPQPHTRRVVEHRSHGDSDSESTRPGSPRSSKIRDRSREKVRLGERVIPHKRKASAKPDSDDEGEPRKIRRQRLPGHGDPSSSGKHYSRDTKLSLGRQPHPDSKTPSSRQGHGHSSASSRHRSTSPIRHPPSHRRSLSTQLPSSNGQALKKRRIPPPLATDHHSDDSSGTGSPHPHLRTLTTPATADSIISPAKMPPHKKHLDAHGQTLLARACAKGEYDTAKARLTERPDDLNVADYAGNTPLQIASLQGHSQIVKLLIDAGCQLDCMNNDRDTPLLDAVDNGHLEVVKLLLDAGVNPRKTNINGEEPIARVDDEMDNAGDIKASLQEARNRPNAAWRRASEEHHGHDQSPQEPHPPERNFRDARSHGPESPRQSPAAISHAALGRRAATSRATKTSNSQLYKPLDDKTLRDAALRGDEETVLRILQVKETFNDPESMVGAARGGHETVMQYLLALGEGDPDPDPVPSLPRDANTPMLAAIGQGTLGIVKLLLDQSRFDPTRKFGGLPYYEIARDRAGPDSQTEEYILKKAYDQFKKSPRDSHKDKSPNRRALAKERPMRVELKSELSRAQKRKASSPTREHLRTKSLSTKSNTIKEKRRAHSFSESDEQASKKGPGRPRKDLPSVALSSRDDSPRVSQKPPSKSKRQETDHGANSSEGEATAAKPRRKLVSGREMKEERERQRRSSMVSNNSAKEAPSPREKDDGLDKVKVEPISEKYHDRAKAIRRDDSKDRLSVSGEGPGKRHRTSVTPPGHASGDREDCEAPVKRRRLDVEGKDKRQRSTNSSPEDRHRKPSTLRESTSSSLKSTSKDPDKAARREAAKAAKLASKSNSSADKPCDSKSMDVDMTDALIIKTEPDSDSQPKRDVEKEKRRRAKIEAKRREEEELARQVEKKQRDEEERKLREAEEARKQEEARRQLEEEEKKRKEAEERKRREEQEAEEHRKREERERLRLAEEERKRKEEEERKKKEEEERIKREEERKRGEEEERRRREEEEARREQLLREAQRRVAEEIERRMREAQEQLRLAQEAEKRRIEAEQRRIREEQERQRIASLPPLLRWFDACPEPKNPEVAAKFTTVQGVRYDTIVPGDAHSGVDDDVRRELWVLNTHAAFLLGEKDLGLNKYPAWPRHPANNIAKNELMGVEGGTYALTAPTVRDLAKELPDYAETLNGSRGLKMAKDRGDAHKLFVAMDLFFVRVSDFMSAVASTPHLRDLEIAVQYRELPLSEEMRSRRQLPLLWKNDPYWANRNYGSAPGAILYRNGAISGQIQTGRLVKTSSTPFPDGPVPRRGFTSVRRDDPEYERLCREQGLEHLLDNNRLPNGTHTSSSPMSPGHLHTLTPITPGTTEPTEADVMPPSHLTGLVSGIGSGNTLEAALPNGVSEL